MWPLTNDECYVSVDVESDGPIPGIHSLLSIGAAAFNADAFAVWMTDTGKGVEGNDPRSIAVRERICEALGIVSRDVRTVRTAATAEPFLDDSGIVHVPHFIATVTRRAEPEPDRPEDEAGKDAYLSYAEMQGWTLPHWEELHEHERGAWRHVAEQIKRGCQKTQQRKSG